jgi:hypothetical protein
MKRELIGTIIVDCNQGGVGGRGRLAPIYATRTDGTRRRYTIDVDGATIDTPELTSYDSVVRYLRDLYASPTARHDSWCLCLRHRESMSEVSA